MWWHCACTVCSNKKLISIYLCFFLSLLPFLSCMHSSTHAHTHAHTHTHTHTACVQSHKLYLKFCFIFVVHGSFVIYVWLGLNFVCFYLFLQMSIKIMQISKCCGLMQDEPLFILLLSSISDDLFGNGRLRWVSNSSSTTSQNGCQKVSSIIIIIDCFYIALFSALKQTHCARMWFYMSE